MGHMDCGSAPEIADWSQRVRTLTERARQKFAEWLVPAAEKLNMAAGLTKDPTLRTFLRSRAAAFLSDDYYQSDKDWMDLNSTVEITIGPYETYEDGLMGLKASFDAALQDTRVSGHAPIVE